MGRFVARRLLQALPTGAGVVLVTFVLFNVVGGSPAALVLGQNAGARALEEFDAARGYDKPLFCGHWTKTRALEPVDFAAAAPGARAAWGAGASGPLRLEAGQELVLPFSFPLPENETWRLTVVGAGPGFPQRGKQFSTTWKKVFRGAEKPVFRAEGGPVDVRRVELEKATRHFFDSQLVDYVGRVLRLDGVRFRIELVEIPVARTGDKDADVLATTAALHAEFERQIREEPAQWMWSIRKWGKLPEVEG